MGSDLIEEMWGNGGEEIYRVMDIRVIETRYITVFCTVR